MTMRTIDDIKTAAAEAGSHDFSAAAMRFFQSRTSSRVFPVDEHRTVFVTSERFDQPGYARCYTVRLATRGTRIRESDGREVPAFNVTTPGVFQEFTDRRAALRAAERHARALRAQAMPTRELIETARLDPVQRPHLLPEIERRAEAVRGWALHSLRQLRLALESDPAGVDSAFTRLGRDLARLEAGR